MLGQHRETLRLYRDILVMPTQDLCNGLSVNRTSPGPGAYRGGPVWPWFACQFGARTCRGWLPWPCDRKPVVTAAERPDTAQAGIWCGPASPHYGHMIADFGMRIAAASRHDPALPLVFSVGPVKLPEPEPFFWQILEHFGVPAERVHLVRRPTRFRRLLVPPQADRLYGRGPDRRHLDLLDVVTAGHGPQPRDLDTLFVSRALYPDGRLAAESYLVDALVRAGVTCIFPETLSVGEQLAHYRRARTIVFTEGSAVHSLQLLGRVGARVVIIARRNGSRIARASLRPRVASLDYWDPDGRLLYGLNARGRPQLDRALMLFDEWDLLRKFKALGLDLHGVWEQAGYARTLMKDVARWIGYNGSWNLHPNALGTIRSQITALHLPVDVDRAWNTDIFA